MGAVSGDGIGHGTLAPEGVEKIDRRALQRALSDAVAGEVRFDLATRAIYSHDSSNYRQPPLGVVIPRDADDVVAAVRACHEHGAPVLPRGCGTSLSGETANVAVVIDTSKYMREIVEIDPERRVARVQPGVIRDQLADLTEERHDLTFAPDTSTHEYATFGGMIGNNSCGVHSVMAGRTADNVEELEIVTYDGLRMRVGPTSEEELEAIVAEGGRRGEIYAAMRDLRDRYADLVRERYPDIPRRVSGYNLDELLPEKGFNVARALVGSEGTLATVLEATVRLVPSPPSRSLLVLGYPSVFEAADHVPEILEYGPDRPGGDRQPPDRRHGRQGPAHLRGAAAARGRGLAAGRVRRRDPRRERRAAEECMERLDKDGNARRDAPLRRPRRRAAALGGPRGGPRRHLLRARRARPLARLGGRRGAAGAARRVPARASATLLDRYDYRAALYGHFGDGCVHCRINFDLRSAGGLRTWRRFLDEAADLVVAFGGSLSGEHGDGQQRAELLPKMYGPELVGAFEEMKRIWDPGNRMNPHKVVDPYPIVSNMKLGTGYSPPEVETHFAFGEDGGSFAHAALRCVGAGKCRDAANGTMCPSFMATKDEEHTTRGRARILYEMLEGDTITDGFRSEEVKGALDLCLSCKGCKGDCPVSVDMATYKAEFLSHHYKGRLRPLPAYSMGLIMFHARARPAGAAACQPADPGAGVSRRAEAGRRAQPRPRGAALRPPDLQGLVRRSAARSTRTATRSSSSPTPSTTSSTRRR